MLNAIIRFSLANRTLVLLGALLVSIYGVYVALHTKTDVLPDLNRPVVTILTEAPGLAPEEVEVQVSYFIETAVNGAPGVDRVRSTSAVGLSVVSIEFQWGSEVRANRQIVQERLATIAERLPAGVVPAMAPISSIMGEIALMSVRSDTLAPMEVRTLAEFTLRPAILSIPGIAQVTVMGGELKQFRVEADPDRLRIYSLSLEDLERALTESSQNTGGGVVATGAQELVVRNLGRVHTAEDIANSLVATRSNGHDDPPRAIRVRDVARVVEAGATTKRGEGSADAHPAVIIAVQKQPTADTVALTAALDETLSQIERTLPPGVVINPDVFRQSHFIDSAIRNVIHALRDGAVLVVIILALFLMNVRTTLITLTALPLSVVATFLVFHWFGMSVNTMTLGGLAVAVGELVDDAVVDVENVFRRLRENRHSANPLPALRVVHDASSEVRNPILMGTLIVCLVFLPTFFLPGVEGRLFWPLAQAYIISIFASLLIALTVTPVLAFYLLPGMKRMRDEKDGPVLRLCKRLAMQSYAVALPRPGLVIVTGAIVLGVAMFAVSRLGSEFLPPFNEGAAVVSFYYQPGISLKESDELGRRAEQAILTIPEVKQVARRTGRAEQDEHALGVNASEIEVDFWTPEEAKAAHASALPSGRTPPSPGALRPQEAVFAEIESKLSAFPGASVGIGQPISHRIEHLLSGVRAQVVIKIFGDDLNTLRTLAAQTRSAMAGIPGVADLQVEQQTLVPQLHIAVKREAAARVGFTAMALTDAMETATKGKVVGRVLDGLRTFDMVLTLDDAYRAGASSLADVRLISPTGAVVLVRDVADITETFGPNQLSRENIRRRIVVSCNVRGRDLGSTVKALQASIREDVARPQGYTMEFGGLHEAQQQSTRLLLILGAFSLAAIFVLLYTHYQSAPIAIQIMLNVPFAFIGSVAALVIAREPFSVASLVGFISLTGIATRNGVLMISHYIHLMKHEGVPFGRDLVIRGSQERVAPVLMTALTAGLGLLPLVLSRAEPGKEILYPVALVILGGLITSTALDFFVTPTIFLRFGGGAAARLARVHCQSVAPQSASPQHSIAFAPSSGAAQACISPEGTQP